MHPLASAKACLFHLHGASRWHTLHPAPARSSHAASPRLALRVAVRLLGLERLCVSVLGQHSVSAYPSACLFVERLQTQMRPRVAVLQRAASRPRELRSRM